MACDIYSKGRVVLVVWGKPQLPDLARLEKRVKEVYEDLGPIIFIARVPAQAAPPDDYMRSALAKFLEDFTQYCLSYHAVFEGSGFFAAAKRTTLATIFLMTGKRKRYYVHSHCDEVAQTVPAEHRPELRSALQEFRSRGLLRYDLNSLRPPESPRAQAG